MMGLGDFVNRMCRKNHVLLGQDVHVLDVHILGVDDQPQTM